MINRQVDQANHKHNARETLKHFTLQSVFLPTCLTRLSKTSSEILVILLFLDAKFLATAGTMDVEELLRFSFKVGMMVRRD